MINEFSEAVIRKMGKQWCIFSEDGDKKLGCYPSREQALKRMRQIEFFKKAREESTGGDNYVDVLFEAFYATADVEIIGSYGFGVSNDETSPTIYYLSDGSVYYEHEDAIFEIEDPSLEFLDDKSAEELCSTEEESV